MFHHCTNLDAVIYGKILPSRKHADEFLSRSYSWFEKEVGFWPLFLSVGDKMDDILMTGYDNNWKVKTSSWFEGKKKMGKYRKKGEFPNYVLFSFSDLDGIFMDYDAWHLVLNSDYKNYDINEWEKGLVFKYSWNKTRWLRESGKGKVSVQLVTRELDLSQACRVWCRNSETAIKLERMGFSGVEIKRIPVCSIF